MMPMSPYCARETIGGTSAVPRALVGEGDAVGVGEAVAEGLTVGVELELTGVTQAPATSAATISPAADFIEEHLRSPRQASAIPARSIGA